ncbi:MAG: dihydromethanopterin reductase (acceptor) [Candidatus Geothermarchaeales archaeon]
MPLNVAWGITGAGHLLLESFKAMSEVKERRGAKIAAFLSSAGYECVRMYGLWESLGEISKKIYVERGASAPRAGPLSTGLYDLFVVSPATANTVAKIVVGIADSLVTNAFAQAQKGETPIFVVPTDQELGAVTTTLPFRVDRGECREFRFFLSCRECEAQRACKDGAIEVGESARIDLLKCSGCGDCVQACPYGAVKFGEKIDIKIRQIDVENVERLREMKGVTVLKRPEGIPRAVETLIAMKAELGERG